MKSGSHWPHIVRGVAGFIVGGAAFGVIQYFAGQGSHHHKTTLLLQLLLQAFLFLHGKVKQMMIFGGVLKKLLVVIKVGNQI